MPLYDFECPQCGTSIEETVRLKDLDSTQVACPNCQATMNRQISKKMSFTLKGSGWSKDGYSTQRDKAGLV